MNDPDVVQRIAALADEEHRLERSHTGERPAVADLARLREIEVSLEQCWDLLRQRRAHRSSGQDPDDAMIRAGGTVEHYQQ